MSPLDEAFHDWADAHEGADSCYDCFVGGWEARAEHETEERAALLAKERRFWELRLASVERERNEALMRLSSAEYERAAFRRQRDELGKLLLEARQEGPREGHPEGTRPSRDPEPERERPHVTEGLGCWCHPRVEAYGERDDG